MRLFSLRNNAFLLVVFIVVRSFWSGRDDLIHLFDEVPPPSLLQSNNNNNNDKSSSWSPSELILLVQGEAKLISSWIDLLRKVNDTRITMYYATFDEPIHDTEVCHKLGCRTAFIPNTTWTEGRNELAKMAYWDEQVRRRGKRFDYWLFSDEDIVLKCVKSKIVESWNCWEEYLRFVLDQAASAKVPVVPIRFCGQNTQGPFAMVDAYDAMVNAFHRDFVPYLLPYTKLPPNASQWFSQGSHFWVMENCLPYSGLAVGRFCGDNTVHREYPRGKDPVAFAQVLKDNYASYLTELTYPRRVAVAKQFQRVKPLQTMQKVQSWLETQKQWTVDHCTPLEKRFHDWVSSWFGAAPFV